MTSRDLFTESYSALAGNKIRSALTMLGIIIGIGSVIALVAVGQGAKNSIQSSINSIGSNLVTVSPGAARGAGTFISTGRGGATTLTVDDEQAIKTSVTGILAVDPEVTRRLQVTAKGTNTNTQIVGTTEDYAVVRNINIASGSFITGTQVQNGSKVAVLGPTTRDDLFGADSDPIGQDVRINNSIFKVIGVTQSKGGTGFFNQDDIVFIPLLAAQHYLSGGTTLSNISVQAASSETMTDVQNQITALLLTRHHITDPASADFTVTNQADILSAASSVTGTFTTLLAAIAGISLVVGGIGIMNMMLTTVTERTREIGLRKAIGATGRDINTQFLTEAIMLTFIGGGIGILIGWLLALAVVRFTGIAAEVSLSSILLAFAVSTGIGLVFGYYPARRASKLSPIEALRFE